MKELIFRKRFEITGIVQGVGFRPSVHRFASGLGLGGSVQNRFGTVSLVLEGQSATLEKFLEQLAENLPPQSEVESLREISSEQITQAIDTFSILPSPESKSAEQDPTKVLFPPDLAICSACKKEVMDPEDRRYGYAFTTCTDCGPRYTVVNAMPYDRERTTLVEFPLCEKCQAEYQDPAGRRFHAESIACADCGPQLSLFQSEAKPLEGNPLLQARQKLSQGEILAVRGVGGYLLAVDGFDREALGKLRARKQRPDKPFAVMARNVEVLRSYCDVSSEQERLLRSPEAPIVILDFKRKIEKEFPLDLLSPDSDTLGAMLPTSAIHSLLLEPTQAGDEVAAFDLLVMTSGNRRGEPICISNQEAFSRLGDIADCFLVHDREINLRSDDSLFCFQGEQPQIWRRARGFAPNGLKIKHKIETCVLAMGAELKNTIALGEKDEIVLSPHIGDLETPEAIAGLEQAVECFPAFLSKTPQVVAVDLHPDMHSSILGKAIAKKQGLEVIEIQHHHAHAGSIMAEHGLDECLALVFDGTGLGADGSIWGAELLHTTLDSYQRLATFKAVPLPGGDAAVKEPLRQVIGRYAACGLELGWWELEMLGINPNQAEMWNMQAQRALNAPLSHAAGRVFDCCSAILGFSPSTLSYEGQAAIRLEAAARRSLQALDIPELPFGATESNGLLEIDWSEAFRVILAKDVLGTKNSLWALAFHHAFAKASLRMIEYGLSQVQTRKIALSGGVFMNRILTSLVLSALKPLGVEVFLHEKIPPNDGGIAAGQVYLAGRK